MANKRAESETPSQGKFVFSHLNQRMEDEDLLELTATGAHVDDELSLPKGTSIRKYMASWHRLILDLSVATVLKIISEMLPPDMACAKETRDLIHDCCIEFIHLIATESNDVCGKTTKKTISAEHVLQALQNLGFESYLDELRALSDEHRQEQKETAKKSSANKLLNSGLTQEELLKQQEELFQQARQRMAQQMAEQQQGQPSTTNGPTASATAETAESTED